MVSASDLWHKYVWVGFASRRSQHFILTIRFMFRLFGGISFTEITKSVQCQQQCIPKLIPRPCSVFCHFHQWRGVGTTPWRCDRPLIVVDLREKKTQSMRLVEISRLHMFLVLGQHLTSLDQVKGQIFAKNDIVWLYTLLAAWVCVAAIWNLHQRVPCSILNKVVLLLYPVATFSS